MGKNKALAHHTCTYFHTRRVSVSVSCFRSPTLAGAPFGSHRRYSVSCHYQWSSFQPRQRKLNFATYTRDSGDVVWDAMEIPVPTAVESHVIYRDFSFPLQGNSSESHWILRDPRCEHEETHGTPWDPAGVRGTSPATPREPTGPYGYQEQTRWYQYTRMMSQAWVAVQSSRLTTPGGGATCIMTCAYLIALKTVRDLDMQKLRVSPESHSHHCRG